MAKEVLTEERYKNDHHHHEERALGCGHDRHEDACGCGHDHHHECMGCGHDSIMRSTKRQIILLIMQRSRCSSGKPGMCTLRV